MTGSKGSPNFFHIKTWSRCCVEHYWKLGGYAANLPPERWISRVLAWNPLGRRRSGCPRTSWPSKFISYTRYRHLGHWQVLARDPDLWRGLMDDFCMFCGREWNAVVVFLLHLVSVVSPAPKWAADRRAGSKSKSFNCVVNMSTHSLFHVASSSSSVHEELLLSLLLVVRTSTGVIVCSTE